MKHFGMAYNIKNRASSMAKGGAIQCAHGGPAYCNKGCYDEGGEVEAEPVAVLKEDLPASEAKEPAAMPSSRGMMAPKAMAQMIMGRKASIPADESMPLDHAEEDPDFLTAEDEPKVKKTDLLTRVMMKTK